MADKPITDAGVIEQIRAAMPLATPWAKGMQGALFSFPELVITDANTAPDGAYRFSFTDYQERNLPFEWGILLTITSINVIMQFCAASQGGKLFYRCRWDDWSQWREI